MMKNSKHILILASVAVIFIIATLFSGPTDDEISGAGDKMYPDLLPRANDVSYIKIQTNQNTLTLTKDQDLWTVKEHDNYPAALDKVRELVLGVGNLTRVEPKTRKPENYSRIGLQDVSEQGSTSIQITMIAGSDKKLADLIIGDSKPAKGDASLQSYYIRTAVPDKWEPKDWLDVDIIELKRERIQQVKVNHADGELVYIHRDNPDTRDFTLDSLQPGEQVTAPYEVNNIATTFTKMTFDDVVSAANAGVGDKPVYSAVLTTFDGLEITFEPFTKDDKHFARYSARYNADAAKAYQDKQAQQGSAADAATVTTTNDPHGDASKQPVELKSAEEVAKEVETFNNRWQNWMYQLPDFRVKNIGKKKTDLLKKDDRPVH
ncbi:MAG: hypothetical protein AMJ55_11045 [Gammaproteobacteria bacterium SG8_15]|nr:MAG: hypothetical protein AMJ55_11045 [Gammaproteobacteria bacterium SG8_15]